MLGLFFYFNSSILYFKTSFPISPAELHSGVGWGSDCHVIGDMVIDGAEISQYAIRKINNIRLRTADKDQY